MKKIIIALLILYSVNSSAQIAIKQIQFRPVGDFGMTFSKGFTGELMYLQPIDEDEAIRMRFGITYISLKPRLDSFPIYGVKYDNGLTVLPGYQVYHQYSLMYLFAGVDYAPIRKEHYSLYAGCDLLFGGVDQKYDRDIQTMISESYSGGTLMPGARLRIGGEYMFNDKIGTFLEVTRAFYLSKGGFLLSNNDIGIGVHILFN